MDIRIAGSDDEIAACFAVMRELRPHLAEENFVARVRLQEQLGYRLAYCSSPSGPVAVAGFRVVENLAWGRFLYVDDLATLATSRSRGYGAALLSWLSRFASAQRCAQLHLDSGVHRKDAHRFYAREKMTLASYHFSVMLDGGDKPGPTNSGADPVVGTIQQDGG